MMREKHHAVRAPTVDPWIWMAEDEGFPLIVLEMNCNNQMTSAHVGELYEFMTAPADTELDERFASQCPRLHPARSALN